MPDMTPEVIPLENGQVGYFYTLQQLEEYYLYKLYKQTYDEIRRYNPLNPE